MGARHCSASASPRWSGFPVTTSCGRTAGTRCACAARSGTSTSSRYAAGSASSRRRTRTRSGQATDGPVVIAPLFVLVRLLVPASRRCDSTAEGLAQAYGAGVVSTDERWLHPDPFPSREAWCDDRLARTERRLAELPPALPTVLVNHFPLVREPTAVMRYPVFAQWCGTVRTADWPARFRAAGRRVRAPAHPADDVARRRPARGGVARLSARVEAARRRAGHPAPDPARSPAS